MSPQNQNQIQGQQQDSQAQVPIQSQIPTQSFHTLSRHNSNTSTSSSNRGDHTSSIISNTNSISSTRSHQTRHLLDHRQLFATCGTSTPIRSFQRATISSVVKTRAFDNNPVLKGLLTPTETEPASNSQTPSPHSTPLFSRSRSLRMSGGPHRYQHSPSHYRSSSRTPELYGFNPDMSTINHESQTRLAELTNEKLELKESLEFLECERQVLIDSTHELKESLHNERSQHKKELDDLRRQLQDTIATRVKAESQLIQNELEMNNVRQQIKRTNDELAAKNKQLESLSRDLDDTKQKFGEISEYSKELERMLTQKLRFNGMSTDPTDRRDSDCTSIITEMAKLRLELNEKDKIIERFANKCERSVDGSESNKIETNHSHLTTDIDSLNNFLNQTVECIRNWPDDLAGSCHVQDLMKTLLSAYKIDQEDLVEKFANQKI